MNGGRQLPVAGIPAPAYYAIPEPVACCSLRACIARTGNVWNAAGGLWNAACVMRRHRAA